MEKRHTPKTGFPFIIDNEFEIDNYQFPELPSMFLKIDRPIGVELSGITRHQNGFYPDLPEGG
ncbi:hypothetical protein RDWZM_001448 [Blomia tropicalis]|uniref:Uncharacterized protein n=1 Tax=Blomia tropicalis TaxID=40697 RepID=A0A9Q0MAM1_BLOTA|nr:hypothetical protein RDWZM_001448 [Blomia tropicalis]